MQVIPPEWNKQLSGDKHMEIVLNLECCGSFMRYWFSAKKVNVRLINVFPGELRNLCFKFSGFFLLCCKFMALEIGYKQCSSVALICQKYLEICVSRIARSPTFPKNCLLGLLLSLSKSGHSKIRQQRKQKQHCLRQRIINFKSQNFIPTVEHYTYIFN